jgi:hypothetical protein
MAFEDELAVASRANHTAVRWLLVQRMQAIGASEVV